MVLFHGQGPALSRHPPKFARPSATPRRSSMNRRSAGRGAGDGSQVRLSHLRREFQNTACQNLSRIPCSTGAQYPLEERLNFSLRMFSLATKRRNHAGQSAFTLRARHWHAAVSRARVRPVCDTTTTQRMIPEQTDNDEATKLHPITFARENAAPASAGCPACRACSRPAGRRPRLGLVLMPQEFRIGVGAASRP